MGKLDGKKIAFLAADELEKRDTFTVDRLVADAEMEDYDGLVLPGGVINPDKLRADEDAVEFVRSFVEAGKPVGATDLENAGADWVDEECVVDNGLVTSRSPDDLPVFCSKVVEELCEGVHA